MGTGHEKFYNVAETSESLRPPLHTGFVSMEKVAGRADIETRNDQNSKHAGENLTYEPDKIRSGQHMLSNFRQAKACVPFSALPNPREVGGKKTGSTDYEALLLKSQGSPASTRRRSPDRHRCSPVTTSQSPSFRDFLPNSIRNSPQRRGCSHSNTTQRLGLSNNSVRANVLMQPFIPATAADESAAREGSSPLRLAAAHGGMNAVALIGGGSAGALGGGAAGGAFAAGAVDEDIMQRQHLDVARLGSAQPPVGKPGYDALGAGVTADVMRSQMLLSRGTDGSASEADTAGDNYAFRPPAKGKRRRLELATNTNPLALSSVLQGAAENAASTRASE